MADIFISYRREDTGGHAGRLCDRLSALFGEHRVFMDVQDIQPGQDFARSIEETIGRCAFVVAVIGPRWLPAVRERAHTDHDFVRQEIAAALRRGVTVIPVLVGGAEMPESRQLPADLAELSHRQAVELRDDRFDDDVARLADVLRTGVSTEGPRPSRPWSSRPPAAVALAVALVAAAGLVVFLWARPGVADVGGRWIAEMHKDGQRPFRIRLDLEQAGERVAGAVQYPTGRATIHDGRLVGSRLTFFTTHVPQFETRPATIRVDAEVGVDELRLTVVDDGGLARGIARRAPP